MLSLLFFIALGPKALWAAPNYLAERDPPRPEAKKQYRLWLRTPDRACNTWRKVSALIPREDLLLSETRRDETGKTPGCKFLWVITPAAVPGDMKFTLQGMLGPTEMFEVPGASAAMTDEAPATAKQLKIPNALIEQNKSSDPSTGK